MRKIVFTSTPAYSHIAPMLPLVDSAVRAGHEVIFVTGPEGIPWVTRPGVHAIELGPSMAESAVWYGDLVSRTRPASQTPDDALQHYVVNVLGRFLGLGMAANLVPLVASLAPDLVISETSELAGRAAAVLAGVPHIVHGYGPQQSAELGIAASHAVAVMQESLGISVESSGSWREGLYLDVWPAAIDDDSEKMFTNVLPLRPAAVNPALPADPVLEGLPFGLTVYVTLGTTFNTSPSAAALLDRLVSVFVGQRINAIVTVGRDGDVGRFAGSGRNIRVRDFINQDAVIPHVDAVLSHAGAGTSLGALAHGIPHVMIPFATDQHRIAARVAGLGAGLLLPSGAPVDDIRSALHAVITDQSFGRNAHLVTPILRAIPNADRVLRELLSSLTTPHSSAFDLVQYGQLDQ
jgi:UDP-N-acetylglucosamine transferase subunit ALG13